MIAYLILLFAILSRVLPHPALYNFTAVGAGLLYFGARRSRWQIVFAVLALAATDYFLTTFRYGYDFHIGEYLITWSWYAGVALLGSSLLRRSTVLRVGAGVLTSATSFFLLSNIAVWPHNPMYSQDARGLFNCLVAGLPFYRNDLISTGLFAAVFFGWAPVMQWISSQSHGKQTAA
jgi:hypothetical protein